MINHPSHLPVILDPSTDGDRISYPLSNSKIENWKLEINSPSMKLTIRQLDNLTIKFSSYLQPRSKIQHQRSSFSVILAGCLLFVVCCLLFPPPAHATDTYYISPNGNDSADGRSPANAWRSFERAMPVNPHHFSTKVTAGDTLILLDGTYTNTTLGAPYGFGRNQANPQYTTIKALNDGQAIINAQDRDNAIRLLGNDYFQIEGIVAHNSQKSVVEIFESSHNIFRRVSVYNTESYGNHFTMVIGASSRYNLVEDCITAGKGRISLLMYGGGHNTIRRCLSYWTDFNSNHGCNHDMSWPWGEGYKIYNSNHNLIESSIGMGPTPLSPFIIISNSTYHSSNHNRILGSMALNAGYYADGTRYPWEIMPEDPSCFKTVSSTVDPKQRSGLSMYGVPYNLRHNTVTDFLSVGSAGAGLHYYGDHWPEAPYDSTLTRLTLLNNGRDIRNGGSWGFGGIEYTDLTVENYAGMHNNQGNQIIDSVVGNIDGNTNHPFNGTGAKLTHQYFNGITTQQPLWPWPMEDRVRHEFSTYLPPNDRINNYSITCAAGSLVNEYTNFPITNIDVDDYCSGTPPPSPTPHPADRNGDGVVNIFDLNQVIANFTNLTLSVYQTVIQYFGKSV